jgi:hypothetical protein
MFNKRKNGQIKSWISPTISLPKLATTMHTGQKSQKIQLQKTKQKFSVGIWGGEIPKHDNIMKGQYWNGSWTRNITCVKYTDHIPLSLTGTTGRAAQEPWGLFWLK